MQKQNGAVYLVLLLVMSGVFIFLATAIMGLAFANLRLARHNESMVSSLSVAEAGVNYYLWHLAHDPLDYCDGFAEGSAECPTTPPANGYGPYRHDFKGPDGTVLGSFTLTITPPSAGETIYDIKSVGTAKDATVSRTIRADIGIPSFAAYALLSNTSIWLGISEATDGPVHSNGGIRYDYPNANDIISSSVSSYTPSTRFGGDGHTVHNGVWSPDGGGPAVKWQFDPPATNIDFDKIAINLTTLKSAANANGIYLSKTTGNNKGYYLKLISDKIEIRKVTAETVTGITTGNQIAGSPFNAPSNGILFADDYLWVDGTWNNKITIASSKVAKTGDGPIYMYQVRPAITIKGNLTYVSPREDGTKKIGLVAAGDIGVPPYAPSNLEIDAAMASKSGHVWYPQQLAAGSTPKSQITIYGSISSFLNWTWSYVFGPTTVEGFINTTQIYDRHLTIDPPPNFPTTGNYQILTWREE